MNTKQWLYFVGFIDILAVSLIVPSLPLYARSLSMSNVQIGFLVAIYGACQMVTSPFVGSVSDKTGPKLLLIVSMMMTSLSYAILAVSINLTMFVVGRIIAGICKHTGTLTETYISLMYTESEAIVVTSDYYAISNLGNIAGPLIGAPIADKINGFSKVCFMASVIFLINIGIVIAVIPSVKKQALYEEDQQQSSTLFGSLSVLEFGKLIDPLMFRFLTFLAVMLYRDTYSLMLSSKYNASLIKIGYILSYQAAVGAVTGFAVSPLVGRVKTSKLLLFSTLTLFVSLWLFAITTTTWTMLAISVPFSFSHSILRVVTQEQLLNLSSPEEKGVVLGLSQSSVALARMISPVASGLLLDLHDDGPAIGGAFVSSFSLLLAVAMIIRPDRIQSNKDEDTSDTMMEYFRSMIDWI